MRLANMLKEAFIIESLRATTKEEAIDELLELLHREMPRVNIATVREMVLEREEIENTSYGRGFAFPHARTDEVDDMCILLGISKTGLKDKTPDRVPLNVVVLLLTPSNISKLYLQTLSAFATLARTEGYMQQFTRAQNRSDVVDIIWQTGVRVERELSVKDIMRREVVTVMPEDSLKKVANLMFKNRLSALAVVDKEGKLLGQITDKDLIHAALPDFRAMLENMDFASDVEPFEELLKQEDKIRVSQLYKTDHVVVTTETKLVEAAALMIFKDLRRVFVAREGRLLGILLRKDIVNIIIRG